MSYDLIVWKSPAITDLNEFHDRLVRFDEAHDTTTFDASDDVLRFYDDLLSEFPPLESYPENEIDSVDPSWSMTPERSDRLVSMHMAWSGSEPMALAIVRLSAKHRLMLYGPQGPDIFPPPSPQARQPFRNSIRLLVPLGALAIGMSILLAGLMKDPTGIWALVGLGVMLAAFAALLFLPLRGGRN